MHLIIDGYNLLNFLIFKAKSPSISKDRLIHIIIKYSDQKNLPITLVFDGGNAPHLQRERHQRVNIEHAGYHQSADDRIQSLIAHATESCIVISNDHALQKFAKKYDQQYLPCDLFATKLPIKTASVQPKTTVLGNPQKTSLEENKEIDSLMYALSKAYQKDNLILHEGITDEQENRNVPKTFKHILKKL
jgi:predicted RNA-binding protein with PIN domain